MNENEKKQLYRSSEIEPIDLLREAVIKLKAASTNDLEEAKQRLMEEQKRINEEKEALVFYSRYKDYSPTQEELERIVAKGKPRERAYLYFYEDECRKLGLETRLTDEQFEALRYPYRKGTKSFLAYDFYISGAKVLQNLVNPFFSTYKCYDRDLSGYDVFLSIFYGYWEQAELMNGALRIFDLKGKKIPDSLRGWAKLVGDNEALEDGKELSQPLRDFFASKTFPCGVLKQNEEGLFYVDITEGEKPLYNEFLGAIERIEINLGYLKTLTEEIAKFVRENSLEDFVPFMMQDYSDILFGIDSKTQEYITPDFDELSYFLSEYKNSIELPSRGKEMFAALSKLIALLPNYYKIKADESVRDNAIAAVKQRKDEQTFEEVKEKFLLYGSR